MSDVKMRQADIDLIERSGLFAGNWYHKVYGVPFHRDAIKHYHEEGWRKGYNPSPDFITIEYLLQNPRVQERQINPLLHYLKTGKAKGLNLTTETYRIVDESSLFDRAWYIKTYHIPEGEDALVHYLQKGWKLGYNPSKDFCTEEYLNANHDVRQAKRNPLAHYLLSGKQEGRRIETNGRELLEHSEFFNEEWYRKTYHIEESVDAKLHYMLEGWKQDYNPSPLFVTGEYLRQNPDVSASGKNPLIHYLNTGKNEGRQIETDERKYISDSQYFDEEWYHKTYEIPEGTDAKYHYLVWGWKLGYNPSMEFSTNGYLRINSDVNGVSINPLLHYMRSGKQEGRQIEKVQYVEAKPVNGKGVICNSTGAVRKLPAVMISFVDFSDGEGEITPISLANELYSLGYSVLVHTLGYKTELEEVRNLLNENIYVLKTDDKDIIVKYLKLFEIEVVNTHHLDCEKIFSQIVSDPRQKISFFHVASIHNMYHTIFENRFKNAMDIIAPCVKQWTYSQEEHCHYFKELDMYQEDKFHPIGVMAEAKGQSERWALVEKYLDVFFQKDRVETTQEQPLVTIFLRIRQGEDNLQQCLQSIYRQSYKKIQVRICFRELKEEEKEIIEFYKGYYKTNTEVMQLEEPDKWLPKNMKESMNAKGEILWFLEHNPVFEFDYLEKLLPSFEDKRVAIVYGKSVFLNASQESKEDSYHRKGITEISCNMFSGNPFLNFSAVLLRKSMVVFEEEPWKKNQYDSNLQWDVCVEMLERNYIVYQSDAICYTKPGEKISPVDETYYLEKAQIIKKLVELYELSKDVSKAAYHALLEEYSQAYGISIAKAKRKLYKTINYVQLLLIKYGKR